MKDLPLENDPLSPSYDFLLEPATENVVDRYIDK